MAQDTGQKYMLDTLRFHQRRVWKVLLAVPVVSLPMFVPPALCEDQLPSLQDMQIVGRVLGLQEKPVSGDLRLAIAYNPADAASTLEAKAIAGLIGSGLSVDSIVLHSVLVPQADLATVDHVGAILASTAVDEQLLRAAPERLHVPCLTFHRQPVERGACMVALRSAPTVNIVLNEAAATAAGVHFATAFRMMVQEL